MIQIKIVGGTDADLRIIQRAISNAARLEPLSSAVIHEKVDRFQNVGEAVRDFFVNRGNRAALRAALRAAVLPPQPLPRKQYFCMTDFVRPDISNTVQVCISAATSGADSERSGFIEEMATQYGFAAIDDDADLYVVHRDDLFGFASVLGFKTSKERTAEKLIRHAELNWVYGKLGVSPKFASGGYATADDAALAPNEVPASLGKPYVDTGSVVASETMLMTRVRGRGEWKPGPASGSFRKGHDLPYGVTPDTLVEVRVNNLHPQASVPFTHLSGHAAIFDWNRVVNWRYASLPILDPKEVRGGTVSKADSKPAIPTSWKPWAGKTGELPPGVRLESRVTVASSRESPFIVSSGRADRYNWAEVAWYRHSDPQSEREHRIPRAKPVR